MPGVKILDLNLTTNLNDTDHLVLARPGIGNGFTYKIPGSIFAKSSDVLDLQNQINGLDGRVTSLEGRMTSAEARLLTLENRAGSTEGSVTDLTDRVLTLEDLVNDLINRKRWSGHTCPSP